MRTKLFCFYVGLCNLACSLVGPVEAPATQLYSALQLVTGYELEVSYLRFIECAVYVPIVPSQRIKLGPQHMMGIYVDYQIPSIAIYSP